MSKLDLQVENKRMGKSSYIKLQGSKYHKHLYQIILYKIVSLGTSQLAKITGFVSQGLCA